MFLSYAVLSVAALYQQEQKSMYYYLIVAMQDASSTFQHFSFYLN